MSVVVASTPVTARSHTLAGGEAATEDLEQYRRELTGYCYRMLGSVFEADDAVQETMVRAWRGLDAFEGRYSYSNGRVTFANASAYGSSIGASGNGVLDFERDTADLSGTLVPAYALNRVLGKIPVIGSLLTGGENEGIIAATYRVEGPIDDPKVEINPLSALAPGFLRNLFGLGADKAPAASQ